MVTRFSCEAIMFRSTCCAVASETVAPVSDAYAIKRVSAPSNSRTLDLIARAIYSATSSGNGKRSFSAFFCTHMAQPRGWIALLDGVPDRMHKVGLAHAHTAIEK